ncbi:MAG: OmpA family protein, partial [Dysgonamonadaceae bacterium]|nr:OmpA family protein [Dysgonamonadaceae bacterium]
NAHFDALWNLANYWGAYSPDKVVSFGPYAGFGFAHFVKNKNSRPYHDSKGHDSNVPDGSDTHSNGLSINAGLNLGFNLSKRVNLNLDFGAEIFPDYFDVDLASTHLKNDVVMGISGGITFKLGKVGFEKVELKDDALLNELNGKINALRAENAELSKRPDSCPECPKAPVVQIQTPEGQTQAPVVQTPNINYVPNVVLFRLNSYEIDANQQISVYNTAKFMENTGKSIKVVGYADRATGTSSYNMELSKKRARAVAKELITKYNIPSEKIIVEWKDSNKQPYPQNNWNRVVIMSVPN